MNMWISSHKMSKDENSQGIITLMISVNMHMLSLTVKEMKLPPPSLSVLPTVDKGTVITEELFFWVTSIPSWSYSVHIFRLQITEDYQIIYRACVFFNPEPSLLQHLPDNENL